MSPGIPDLIGNLMLFVFFANYEISATFALESSRGIR